MQLNFTGNVVEYQMILCNQRDGKPQVSSIPAQSFRTLMGVNLKNFTESLVIPDWNQGRICRCLLFHLPEFMIVNSCWVKLIIFGASLLTIFYITFYCLWLIYGLNEEVLILDILFAKRWLSKFPKSKFILGFKIEMSFTSKTPYC